jgi:hypothetical protein
MVAAASGSDVSTVQRTLLIKAVCIVCQQVFSGNMYSMLNNAHYTLVAPPLAPVLCCGTYS